jgi:hypothetical protein
MLEPATAAVIDWTIDGADQYHQQRQTMPTCHLRMSKKLRRKRLRQLWNIKLRSRNPLLNRRKPLMEDDVEENSACEHNLIAFANGFSSGPKTRTKSNWY